MSATPTFSVSDFNSLPPEQKAVVLAYAEFEKRLLPAKLKATVANYTTIEMALRERGLSHTSENMMTVAKALLQQLDWEKAPAKLVAMKEGSKPFLEQQKSAVKEESTFVAKLRAGEKADAYQKAQKDAERQIELLISNFMPVNKRGAIDYALRERVQKSLQQQFATHKKNGADMAKVVEATAHEIQRVYRELEKASERV